MFQCLSDMKLGEKAKIVSLDIVSPADRQKLFACGLLPGVTITIERIAPLGDPMQIRLEDDVLLSIRKTEGCNVKVDSLNR